MIARVWHGLAPPNKTRKVAESLQNELLQAFRRLPGHRSALLLARGQTDCAEFDPDRAKAEQYARWRELRKLQQQNEKDSPAPSPN